MKKLCFFFVTWIGFILLANAQDFKGGLIAGVNTSQIDGDGYGGFNKVGFIFGGFVSRNFNEKLTGQFEMIYIGKGSVKPAHPDRGDYTFRKIHLDYIEMPLILKIFPEKLLKKENLKFIFDIGLSYSVLMSNKEMDEFGEVDIIKPFKSGELSYQIGINYAISENLFVNFRSSRSITPIANKVLITSFGIFGGSFNNLISLTLGYQFSK